MTPIEFLIGFVLSQAQHQPTADRVRLYLGLAAICGDAKEEKAYRQMAAALGEAEALCRNIEFSFVQSRS
jgi:hypothetical protein